MKYKNYVSVFLLGLLTLNAFAQSQEQQQEPQKFSLQDAITYAKKYNYTLKNAQLDQQFAKKQVAEVRAMGLPQITATGNLTNNIEVATLGIIDFPGMAPTPAKFGQPYTAVGTLSANQLLFDGGFLMGLQAAKEFEAISKFNAQRTEQETELAIVKAYCLALVTDESLKLIEANLATLEETRKNVNASYKVGFVEKTDADRVSLLVNNLQILKKKMQDAKQVSYALLRLQLGLKANTTVELTDNLDKLNAEAKADMEIPAAVDYAKRPEYRMVNQQMRLYNLDKKRYQYGYIPSLVAFAQHQQNAFNEELGPLFKKFYPGTLVGLSVTVPIFDGFSKRSKIQQAGINIAKTENTKAQLEGLIETEVLSAKANYLRAKDQLDLQKLNMQLAGDIHKSVNTKYQAGLSSSLDLITADNDLKTAQTNYLQAVYDLMVSKAELKKAIGQ